MKRGEEKMKKALGSLVAQSHTKFMNNKSQRLTGNTIQKPQARKLSLDWSKLSFTCTQPPTYLPSKNFYHFLNLTNFTNNFFTV